MEQTNTLPNPQSILGSSITEWHTLEDMSRGWPVVQHMYPSMERDTYLSRIEHALTHGMNYRQFAYIQSSSEDTKEEILGLLGLWLFPRVWCGLQGDIDNFVVSPSARSQGIGKQLLEHAIQTAKANGAEVITLDTFVENPESHRFYFREGFTIRGYHFIKPLNNQSIW